MLELNEKSEVPKEYRREALGILPNWVMEYNVFYVAGIETAGLKDYMQDVYPGGSLYQFEGEVLEDGTYRSIHKEDEDMPYIGKMKTPHGVAYFYDCGIVALPQKNNTHYITRMD